MTNVDPKWRTHQKEQFGEQRYVTDELLQQFGQNEHYLYLQAKALDSGLPANIRQYFNIINYYDEANSYGAVKSGNHLEFNNNLEERLFIDFNDSSLLDLVKSTVDFVNFEQVDADNNSTVIKQCRIPKESITTVDKSTRTYGPLTSHDSDGTVRNDPCIIGAYYYISWDRARAWESRPNWVENWWSGEIPNICRAQTFKAKTSGILTDITLALKEEIQGTPQVDLVLEIRTTEVKDGEIVPTALVGDGSTVLAREYLHFKSGGLPNQYTVHFKQPPVLEENKHYCFVLKPKGALHPDHPYFVGGWSKYDGAEVYSDGHAFYSFNNGFTWTKYSEQDENVHPYFGHYPAQDFFFICSIASTSQHYIKNMDKYLYLKPIMTNPVSSVEISVNDTVKQNTSITYQVSTDGTNWITFPANRLVNFSTPSRLVLIRAVLKTSVDDTPSIDSLNVILHTNASEEFYIRTHSYAPKTSGLLSASCWSRIYSKIEYEPSTTVTGELLSLKTIKESFELIEPDDLKNYLWINELDKTAINESDDLAQYITDHPSVLTILKAYNVYVLGFITDISFFNSPAYPNLNTYLISRDAQVKSKNYREWYDFTIDYDKDLLTFKNPNSLIKGTLEVTFNPILVKGLTPEELGRRDTNLEDDKAYDEEGLRLDNINEKITVTDDMVENKRVKLKFTPVDPIKHLYLNDTELMQDRDYSIDMKNREIVFIVAESNESNVLNLNDVIEVNYVPNLDDDLLTLAFYGKRTNVTKNVRIYDYNIDYKV